MKECYKLLERYHRYLTRQQLLTLKGQIKSGDYEGFKKGLFRIMKGSGKSDKQRINE